MTGGKTRARIPSYLDGCETYVPEPSPAFDPPDVEFYVVGNGENEAKAYVCKTGNAKAKDKKGKGKGRRARRARRAKQERQGQERQGRCTGVRTRPT